MNSREHIDLTKMAITAMMVTLVLGALLALFFFLYTFMSKKSTDAQQIITTTSTEKLSDLCNATNSGDMPWVTSVINSLTEVEDPNLLYIQVVDNNTGAETFFTYEDVSLQGVNLANVKQYQMPIDACCQYLLGFSNKRCGVQYLQDNNNLAAGGLPFDCLQITILTN